MRMVILVLGAVMAVGGAAAQSAPVKPYDPAIARVVGRAEVYLPPDQARVGASFYAPGKTAAEAVDAVARRARALEQAVRAIDPAKVKVERADSAVSPVMQEGGERRPDRIRGYEARTEVTILVEDLALLTRVVEAAVNAQPDTFSDVAFSIRDTLSARRKARQAAIDDAVDKAKIYVEGAGHRLGRLLLVEEGDRDNIMAQSGNRALSFARSVDAAVAAPPVAMEPQLYTAEVTVVYEVGPVR
jgi:hypothetical protein